MTSIWTETVIWTRRNSGLRWTMPVGRLDATRCTSIQCVPRDNPLSHCLGGIHYIFDAITPLPCYQLSTISGFPITPPSESSDHRDLPVLRGEEIQ